jgi:hypothetical protein
MSQGQQGHKHLCFKPFVCGAYMIILHMAYLGACQTKGYMACPLCGLDVDTKRLVHLKKKCTKGIDITLV